MYQNCTFIRCQFEGVNFWEASFIACQFPETELTDVTFSGSPADMATTLTAVDFGEAKMDALFQLGVDLSSVRLPKEGLRVFRNPDNELGTKLVAASGIREGTTDYNKRFAECPRRGLLLLGGSPADLGGSPDRSRFKIQDPLVFSVSYLAKMAAEPDARRIFESAVDGYEIS